MCFAIYATRSMSSFNDVIRFALYRLVTDDLVCGGKAVAQVRRIVRLPRSISQSHSAHASTSGGPTDSSSRPPSPSMEGKQSTPTGSTSGASTSPTNGKPDGAIYFECLNCKRQVGWILPTFAHIYSSIYLLQHTRQNSANQLQRLHPIDMLLTSPRVWGLVMEIVAVGRGTPPQSPG